MTPGTTEAMTTISTLHTYHLHTTVALFHYLITSIYWNKGSEVTPRNLFSLVVQIAVFLASKSYLRQRGYSTLNTYHSG
jgi:hypothetical protein